MNFAWCLVIIVAMKKLSKLLSKKFNELHLLMEQTESKDTLKVIADGLEDLQDLYKKRTNQVNAYVSSAESEILLDKCLNHAFPDYYQIGKILKVLQPEDKDVKNVYHKKYLPLHTNDIPWLAKYLREVSYRMQTENNAYKLEMGAMPEELKEISLSDIENYIIKSKKFANSRNKFEENIVTHIMVDKACETEEGSASWFRRMILNEVKEMGINEQRAAVAMEKDKRWRNEIFKNGFRDYINRNRFSLMIPNQEERAWLKANHYIALVGLEMVEKEAFECFKAYEEYKYYQWEDTRKVIDELHEATNNMRMSNKEATNLYEVKLKELCAKLIREVRICRKFMGNTISEFEK